MSKLGATAWVLMAPSVHNPEALEIVIAHPAALTVGQSWMQANVPLRAAVIAFERERGHLWAGELLAQGYRSAVQCCFGMQGAQACRLWMLGLREFSTETAAMLAWHAHCEWPQLRRLMFERRSKLTEREVQCLRYAALGQSQPQIAESMSCSMRTVRFHLENAMGKLGADSSAAAVQRALMLGLS